MAISIMGIRKGRQYGMGETWNIKDLSSFGWTVVIKDENNGMPGKREVLVRRPVIIGEDALINKMEKTYEAEYEKLDYDIKRQFAIRQFLALLIGIPAMLFTLIYLLSTFLDSFLPFTSAIDMGAKKLFAVFGEQVAGFLVLGIRFIFLIIAVICIVFFIVNIISQKSRLKDPLRYYKRTAKVINECLLIAQQRVECIKFNASSAEKEAEQQLSATDMSFLAEANNFGKQFPKDITVPRKRLMPYFETYKMPEGYLYSEPEKTEISNSTL